MTDASAELRAGQLYDEGAAGLAALWDDALSLVRYADHPELHTPRATLAYAQVLLRAGGAADIQRASRAIRAVLALQERREQHAHHGNFRWMYEHAGVNDLNGVEFMLDGLNALVREPNLPAGVADEVRESIALGLEEIDRLDVHLGYTNIALSDICNSILGGEAIGDEAFVERGELRLDDWLAFTARAGAPHEYNSPTYLAVDLLRMAVLAAQTNNPDIALKARIAEEILWLHVAAHYHPGLAQLSGPHARSYFDGWTGAGGYLKLLLWRVLGDAALRRPTPYAARHREEGHIGCATEELHCPAYIEAWMRERAYPFESDETVDAERGLRLSTYMTEAYALGSATRAPVVGDPPEPWNQFNSILLQFQREQAPGYGTLFARYVPDDQGLGAGAPASTSEDWWDISTFVAAQQRNRAIVAYGLVPRIRAVKAYKLSVNMLGVFGADIRVGGRGVNVAERTPVEPGEAVCVAVGSVYVAVIPLEPSDMGAGAAIELLTDGEKLTLDIYNYRGPPTSFWEFRSLSGPFYKGNVRNAFIVEVASRTEFADVDSFAAHIGAAIIADSVDDSSGREIAYASDGGEVTLRYSLWDMSPSGPAPEAPRARAGAADGSGPQLWASAAALMQLSGARLLAGTEAKWLIADAARAHYVVIRPTELEMPLWFETPRTVVECDSFGLGRIELDDATGDLAIAATGEIGAVRIRRTGAVRLSINGIDITESLAIVDDDVREFGGL